MTNNKLMPERIYAGYGGGGLANGIEFIRNPERRKQALASAEAKTLQTLQLVKSAPDNPFGDDDEKIAAEILKGIEERMNDIRRLL